MTRKPYRLTVIGVVANSFFAGGNFILMLGTGSTLSLVATIICSFMASWLAVDLWRDKP